MANIYLLYLFIYLFIYQFIYLLIYDVFMNILKLIQFSTYLSKLFILLFYHHHNYYYYNYYYYYYYNYYYYYYYYSITRLAELQLHVSSVLFSPQNSFPISYIVVVSLSSVYTVGHFLNHAQSKLRLGFHTISPYWKKIITPDLVKFRQAI